MNVVSLAYQYISEKATSKQMEDASKQFYARYLHSFPSPPPMPDVLRRAAETLLKRLKAGLVPPDSPEIIWGVSYWHVFPLVYKALPAPHRDNWALLLPRIPPGWSCGVPQLERFCLHHLPAGSRVHVITTKGAVQGKASSISLLPNSQYAIVFQIHGREITALLYPYFPVYLLELGGGPTPARKGLYIPHRFIVPQSR